jgi:hypothetical protein
MTAWVIVLYLAGPMLPECEKTAPSSGDATRGRGDVRRFGGTHP